MLPSKRRSVVTTAQSAIEFNSSNGSGKGITHSIEAKPARNPAKP
jgi:hypothetical protein